jgi:hypothetical protein
VTSSQQIIELKAGGREDPDGSRAAAVLAAYFHAEHVRTFRQLLWRRLAVIGVALVLAETLLSVISRTAFVGALVVLLTLGGGAAVAEWQASERLKDLLEGPAKRLTVVRSLHPWNGR